MIFNFPRFAFGMGKKGGRKRTVSSGSSSDCDEDPHEILGKITKQRALTKESTATRVVVERPSPRVNAIFVANPLKKGEMLLFGGERLVGNKCEFYGDTFLFDTTAGTWTLLNLLISPSPRSAHQAVLLPDGKMLMFGGEFGTSKETKFLHFSDTWIFDFKTYAWQALNLKLHPSSRSGHRIAVYGNHVILYGGFFDTGSQAKYLDDMWIFNVNTMEWTRVDWMNEYEGRPSARSGFTFVTHPDGALLYGGYSQIKSKKGEMQGQVLNDIWLLRIDPSDIKTLRWKKLKLTPNAPLPRSGSTSTLLEDSLINFGGVIDEELSDEFLMGTCVNGLYKYEFATNGWQQLDPIIEGLDPKAFCGRFNSMMALTNGSLYIYGGIFEVGDRQFTLDDMFSFELISGKMNQLQKVSPDLDQCWNLQPEEDDSSDSDSSSGSDSSDGSDNSNGASDSEIATADALGRPVAAAYASLKDFFDNNVDYWMDAARQENVDEDVNDKKLRSTAFMIAKRIWSEQQDLSMNISLE